VLNVVVGSIKEIGDPFVLHPVPRVIFLQGIDCRRPAHRGTSSKSPIIKRVALELGRNTPFVVLDDADLDRAIPAAIFSMEEFTTVHWITVQHSERQYPF
jgi:aldehyde dehydrogenase (NAD+)